MYLNSILKSIFLSTSSSLTILGFTFYQTENEGDSAPGKHDIEKLCVLHILYSLIQINIQIDNISISFFYSFCVFLLLLKDLPLLPVLELLFCRRGNLSNGASYCRKGQFTPSPDQSSTKNTYTVIPVVLNKASSCHVLTETHPNLM